CLRFLHCNTIYRLCLHGDEARMANTTGQVQIRPGQVGLVRQEVQGDEEQGGTPGAAHLIGSHRSVEPGDLVYQGKKIVSNQEWIDGLAARAKKYRGSFPHLVLKDPKGGHG